jgi:hypothetical protein
MGTVEPNKRNRPINSCDDNDEYGDGDGINNDDGNLSVDKVNEFIRVYQYICLSL